jgi:hypothetical protein
VEKLVRPEETENQENLSQNINFFDGFSCQFNDFAASFSVKEYRMAAILGTHFFTYFCKKMLIKYINV